MSTATTEVIPDQRSAQDMVIDIDPLVKPKPKASRRARQRDITPVKHRRKSRIYSTNKLVELHAQQRTRTKVRKMIKQAHAKALVLHRHCDSHVEASIMNDIFDGYDEASNMNQMFNQALFVLAGVA